MVRTLREGERGEVQGVHNGQSKERGSGKMCLDMTAVVPGEHVADDESRTLAEYFKLPECLYGTCCVSYSQPLVSVDGTNIANTSVRADL